MSLDWNYSIEKNADGVSVVGPAFSKNIDWDVLPLGAERLLLQSKKIKSDMHGFEGGVGQCCHEVYVGMLLGLCERKFSGVVSVDTGNGVKRIYFNHGEISFASSNLIDDRLGEIIYRHSMIKLEDMADSAVKVNRNKKFGKVLIENKIFTTIELWDALKLQVMEIVKSTFLAKRVYFQIETGSGLNSTSIIFDQGSSELIEECASSGAVFISFLDSLREDCMISVNDFANDWVEPAAGTFESDFIEVLRGCEVVGDLVKNSKLKEINTYFILFQFVSRGLCKVIPSPEMINIPVSEPQSPVIKSKIDFYHLILKWVKAAFEEDKILFPLADMRDFAKSISSKEKFLIYLGEDAQIPAECILNLFRQGNRGYSVADKVYFCLDSLTQFLLHLATDFLSFDKVKILKENLKQLSE